MKFLTKNLEKRLSTIGILYIMFGLVFAICFALYYRWPIYALFSPGFFAVMFTWPYQAIGFIGDLMYYGFLGKPI
ncbi:hypothetical protein HYS97_01095 [Candidatus Daviesbacteria bacterium]|nr:hypothetical protein [Candidatus Daviesbacteria bacterium]